MTVFVLENFQGFNYFIYENEIVEFLVNKYKSIHNQIVTKHQINSISNIITLHYYYENDLTKQVYTKTERFYILKNYSRDLNHKTCRILNISEDYL
jgi:hypothetical protein